MGEPLLYLCPRCGTDLGWDIDWDVIDFDDDGILTQLGTCRCSCGADVRFRDIYRVTDTTAEVIE